MRVLEKVGEVANSCITFMSFFFSVFGAFLCFYVNWDEGVECFFASK